MYVFFFSNVYKLIISLPLCWHGIWELLAYNECFCFLEVVHFPKELEVLYI